MVANDRSRKRRARRNARSVSPFPDPADRTRREIKKARVREQLYAAALDLFRERGYEATSVQQIADRADTGKSTFFNYFPTKEHVLAAFHDELTARILEGLEREEHTGAEAALMAAMSACAREVKRDLPLGRAIYRTIFGSDVLLSADLENEKRFGEWFLRWIRAGIASGELDASLDAALFLGVLVNILSATVKDWVVDNQRFDLDEALRKKVAFLLSGAKPRPPARAVKKKGSK